MFWHLKKSSTGKKFHQQDRQIACLEFSLSKRGKKSENNIHTSLRREAQQVCLIFQTTAATNNSDKKQLQLQNIKNNLELRKFYTM